MKSSNDEKTSKPHVLFSLLLSYKPLSHKPPPSAAPTILTTPFRTSTLWTVLPHLPPIISASPKQLSQYARSPLHGPFSQKKTANIPGQATITTFLILAVLSALLRTLLRLRYTRSLSTDDYFLLYAVAVLIAAGAVTHGITDLVYLQIYVGLGWTKPAADFIPQMLVFEKRVQAASALAWSSLYAVKLSFCSFSGRWCAG
jgi:hypothetical protein